MQKKLIALAVAGLVSAPAFAQSNVTVYGTIDYGYTLQNRSIYNDTRVRQGIDSGVSKANRLGFKGTEDLGNGLKAVFVLETGIAGDKNGSSGGLWGGAGTRQAYAGLAGSFGTIAFGRQYTPQHLFLSAVDPFAKNGLGSTNNVFSNDARLDNLLAYISPTWGGFSFVAGGTLAYGGDEPNDGNFEDAGDGLALSRTRVWAFAPSYANGGLFLAANIHQAHPNNHGYVGISDIYAKSVKVYDVYAAYDFGSAKLSAAYGKRKTELGSNTLSINDYKIDQWLVGLTVPVSSLDKLQFSYNHRKVKFGGEAAKLGQWAVGYEHSLSKRTALYAQYAGQHQNGNQKELGTALDPAADLADITGARASGVGLSNISGAGYRQGFGIGLRHDF